MRKHYTLSFVLFILISSGFVYSADLSQDEVVAKHVAAVGGREAIEAVTSVRIASQIEEPTFKVDVVYVATREPARMRIDIYRDGKLVYTEGHDGKAGWEKDPNKPVEDSGPAGSTALLHGAILPGKIFGMHEMQTNGHKLEMVGREFVHSVNYYVLKLTLKDGFEMKYYINPDTWLIDSTRDVRALHVGQDPTKKLMETKLTDYRKVDGIMRAFRTEEFDVKTGQRVQQITSKEFQNNPKIDPTVFNRP